MATPAPTIGDLYKRKEVTTEDLKAVVSGWIEDRVEGPVPIGRHAVDVAAAVEAHAPSREVLARDDAPEGLVRTMVRTAIVLAPATKA